MAYDPERAGALCSQCPLRGQVVVPPEGPSDPEFAIVGEGPGYQEEKKKRPFVGASGVLLNEILQQIGLSRSRVLITNSILCRPMVPDPNVRESKRYDIPTYMAWLRKENTRRKKEAKESGQSVQLLSDPFLCCHQRLWNELSLVDRIARERGRPNGGVIVALGNKAMEMTTGKAGVMKFRGSPLKPLGAETP